jgi:hypothetical protein
MEKVIDFEDWQQEAIARFGKDPLNWKFKCPSCGYIATVKEWKEAGAPEQAVAFSCIGRFKGSQKEMGDKTGGPCNYAGAGLFRINPVKIKKDGEIIAVFDFAD